MTTPSKKGPVSVSNTAALRNAMNAGYTADEIEVLDVSAQVASAREEGLTAGRGEAKAAADTARTEGIAQGKREELERIKSVEASVLPGHEALVQTLKYDGKTTGPEAAAQIIAAERTKLGKRVEDINADAAKATVPATPAPPVAREKPKVDPTLPTEDRCKAEWQHDPELRAEFGEVDNYIAFAKAKEGGRIKSLTDRVSK